MNPPPSPLPPQVAPGVDRPRNPLLTLLPWFVLVLFLGYLVFRHFLLIFCVAGSTALLLAPAYRRLCHALGGRRSLAAGLLVVLCTLMILVPVLSYGALMRQQATAFFEWVRPRLAPETLEATWVDVASRYPLLAAILDPGGGGSGVSVLSDGLSRLASTANKLVQAFLAGVAEAVLDVTLFVLMVFFLLRDGGELRSQLHTMSPLSDAQEADIVDHLTRTVSGVLQSMVLVPLAQGLVALVGFVLFGVPAPLLWSVMVVFAALIPILGSPLAWIPAAVYLLVTGALGRAIGMALYGVLVISTIDNVLKPLILSGAARIHTLLGFLSILGGLYAFGPLGLLVGPVVLSLLLSAFRIYREDVLPWLRAAAPPQSRAGLLEPDLPPRQPAPVLEETVR
jgi:predicted PurR-regulated permease PerM